MIVIVNADEKSVRADYLFDLFAILVCTLQLSTTILRALDVAEFSLSQHEPGELQIPTCESLLFVSRVFFALPLETDCVFRMKSRTAV